MFSCGYHITRDGHDAYSWKVKALVTIAGRLAKLARLIDLDDQVEAGRRVFASDTRWTVVRGSDLEEGESHGLPVWSRRVGDPTLQTSRPTTASTRKTAAVVGLLFLTATVAFIFANTGADGAVPLRPDRQSGQALATPPTGQSFWVASATSASTAEVTWPIQDGTYRIVVMHAEGTPGVTTQVRAAVTVPHMFDFSLGALFGGLLLTGGGIAVLVVANRRRPTSV